MLLLRQLPASSIPLSLSSFSSPFSITAPSNSSIFLSLLASIVLLSFIRAAFLYFRKCIGKQPHQQSQVPVDEKTIRVEGAPQRQQRSSWASTLPTWDALPNLTLPVSFTVTETRMIGKGVGLRKKTSEPPAQEWQPPTRIRRSGPAFESPLPAIYQSEVPVSMAKMIMSRHTYRKPTNRPPLRPLLPLPTPRPPTSLAPPPSSLPPTRPSSPTGSSSHTCSSSSPPMPALRTPSMV
ncbi:hypothetical protein L208DRAFT_1408115 [Tricholoma matsutake]|nr:hypothetical protein L208DRAFT_1408115 [Tricholoma matsutake 945]